MHNRYYRTTEATGFSPLNLAEFWEVQADTTYRVHRKPSGRGLLVFVRTLDGAGELTDVDDRTVVLEEDTLFCIEEDRIAFYKTVRADWVFWWFLVSTADTLPAPLQRVMYIPRQPSDNDDISSLATLIEDAKHSRRAYAMAMFSAVVYRWLSVWRGRHFRNPHHARIALLISRLHDPGTGVWSVKRMAEFCRLSERRFRDVFKQSTGQSPKKFFDQTRLRQGRELLRMGVCNVSEAATRLGYSSPFHFSRAYAQLFGEPPSRIR